MRILEHESSGTLVHATAPPSDLSRVVLWCGGTPHTGALLAPVVAAAAAVRRDVLTVARPGFGGAPRREGRTVADGAEDAVGVLERLDLQDVLVVGYSGGGPHALAVAAAVPRRVRAVLTFGGIAPYEGTPEWFTGMVDPSGLQAAVDGPVARGAHAGDFDPRSFNDRDHAALEGEWGALGTDAQAAHQHGPDGEVDDDLAFVRPWGVSFDAYDVPTRLVHGQDDRVVPAGHAAALAAGVPGATAVVHPGDGHVSVLAHLADELRRISSGAPA